MKPKGYFCFSPHNLQAAPDLFRLKVSWNPVIFWRRWRRWHLLRRLNAAFLAADSPADFAIINDGAHNYQIWHYYIKPEVQIWQLTAAGFTEVRLFALSGRELSEPQEIAAETGYMIYYLCQKS